jgi:hypothetical protein
MDWESSMHEEDKRFIHNYSKKTRKETVTWIPLAYKIIIIAIIITIIKVQNNYHGKQHYLYHKL